MKEKIFINVPSEKTIPGCVGKLKVPSDGKAVWKFSRALSAKSKRKQKLETSEKQNNFCWDFSKSKFEAVKCH